MCIHIIINFFTKLMNFLVKLLFNYKSMNDIIQASRTLENYQLPNQIDNYRNLIKSMENEIDKKNYELHDLSNDDIIEIKKLWGIT